MLAVSIWNITNYEDPVPEILAVTYVFIVPYDVLDPTAETNKQDENEQVVVG